MINRLYTFKLFNNILLLKVSQKYLQKINDQIFFVILFKKSILYTFKLFKNNSTFTIY